MDPVELEGLTLESTSDSGDFEVKAGTGIRSGKITDSYVDPDRFGKIKTAKGGQGEGYAAPSKPRKACPEKSVDVVQRVRGDYPLQAKRRQIEGNVVALVTVGKDGSVKNVKVVKSLGFGLDDAATEAFKKWRFKPAEKKCEKVESTIRLNHRFSYSD